MNKVLHAFLLGSSTIFLGAVSYVYQLIVFSHLSAYYFAEFSSLISLINILWVLATGLWFFFLKKMNEQFHDESELSWFIVNWFLSSSIIGLTIGLIYILLSPFIWKFLHINDSFPFLLLALQVILSFSQAPLLTWLQKLQQFDWISISNVFSASAKILLWGWLLLWGAGIYWAILWIILSSAIAIFINIYYLKNLYSNNIKIDIKKFLSWMGEDVRSIVQFLLLSCIIALFLNLDILFVKHFFDNTIAWNYAIVSVIAKVLVFFIISIDIVYYPQLSFNTNSSKKEFDKVLTDALWLMSILFVWGIISSYFLGGFALNIIWSGLEQYKRILIILMASWGLLGVVQFLNKILISYKNHFILYIDFIMLISLIILIYLRGKQSISHIALSFLIISGITAVISFVEVYRTCNKNYDKAFL